MSLFGFFSHEDAARANRGRHSGAALAETLGRAQALRRQHELTTDRLRAGLPFQWEPGVVVRKYRGPSVWERGPDAVHIWLQEPVLVGKVPRPAFEWLCTARLDTDTGELRYEPQAAPLYADGTGGPGAHYEQMPTCKNCLKKAEVIILSQTN
jgi:hypothetical protein